MSTVQCEILIAALYSPFSPAKVRTHIVPQGTDTGQATAAGRAGRRIDSGSRQATEGSTCPLFGNRVPSR